ncbi:MAG: porin [Bacteriovoracia bacterium]
MKRTLTSFKTFTLIKMSMALLVYSGAARAAEPAPAATPSPTATSVSAAAPASPAFVEVGKGKMKFNGLLQSWFYSDSTTPAVSNNFRIRRAELKLSGAITESTRWTVMIDPAKSLSSGPVSSTNDNKVLQDLNLGFLLSDEVELVIGQMKILTVQESLDSSSELTLPERSLISRTLGDQRQMGLQVFYKPKPWRFGWMLSNGGRPNTEDTNTAKDVSFRADVTFLDKLNVGGFLAAKDFRFGQDARYGANVRWNGDAEMIRFEFSAADDTTNDVKVSSYGYAGEAGYTVSGLMQPVFRYERYTPNADGGLSGTALWFGVNCFLSKHNVKLQLAYAHLYDMTTSSGTPRMATTALAEPGRLIILTAQMAI